MNKYEILGDNIRSLRLEKGYSQEKLSLLAGINKNYLSDLERGTRNPTFGILLKIAKALNVPFSDVFKGIEY